MTALTLKEILDLVKEHQGNINLNINVMVQSGSDAAATTSPPLDTEVKFKVETGDKKNNRVKVRERPDTSISEIGYVYQGDAVAGLESFKGFIRIKQPAGWVEAQYLVKV